VNVSYEIDTEAPPENPDGWPSNCERQYQNKFTRTVAQNNIPQANQIDEDNS
jgi:hypothetical protein